MAVWIFFLCSPDCPKQPRIEYPFYRFLYPMICGTISGVECLVVQNLEVSGMHKCFRTQFQTFGWPFIKVMSQRNFWPKFLSDFQISHYILTFKEDLFWLRPNRCSKLRLFLTIQLSHMPPPNTRGTYFESLVSDQLFSVISIAYN